MSRHSIGFRLTVWYAAVLTAGLGVFSGLVWLSLRQQLMADIDQDLAGRASRLESYFRAESAKSGVELRDELEEFCQALPPTSYVHLRGANGFAFDYPQSAAATSEPMRMLQRQFTLNDQAFDLDVGTTAGDVLRVLELLRILLWSLIPVVIAIACVGGAWLSRRALKPVQDITAAALMISIENLSGRLPVPATGDELARLTEVLNSMLARLESAVKTLSQFAADASHELRTPLAVIRTTAELALRRGRTPESYRESLQGVVAEVDRMTQLVEDLLILARSDAEIAEMPRSPVDIRGVLRDVCTEMSSLAETRQIRIKVSLADDAAVVSGNRPALHRLFVVLLDNAIKYSHLGADVILIVDRDDARVSVTIQDFGTGISEANLPHIFKRFYQADRARTGEGFGLGLTLAESIARAHGAAIQVHSTEGAGSSFQVVFAPRRPSAEAPAYVVDSGTLVEN